jgi:nucleosome binding factor SPN SPT16 subunit
VQFYREASDVQFDETGNRKRKYRYGDEDEIEMEQQERKRRQMLNKEFKAFSERVAEAAVNSVRISHHSSLLPAHTQSTRLVTHWILTFPSAN